MKGALRHIMGAFRYSARGFKAVCKSELAFRLDILFCIAAASAIIVLRIPMAHKLWLASTLFFIIAAELINTAIEYVVDRIGPQRHELSGAAKDAGSALVLTAFAYAAFLWIMILFFV